MKITEIFSTGGYSRDYDDWGHRRRRKYYWRHKNHGYHKRRWYRDWDDC